MATCFQRVKHALEHRIQNGGASLLIDGHLPLRAASRLTNQYFRLDEDNHKGVDYSTPEARLAYLYTSVAAHADWMSCALTSERKFSKPLLAKSPLNILSVGGGGGSDLVGVTRAAELCGEAPFAAKQFNFHVIDRNPDWAENWEALADSFSCNQINWQLHNIDLLSHPSDLFSRGDIRNHIDIRQMDFVICSFVFSELWNAADSHHFRDHVYIILMQLRSGAIVFYQDNHVEFCDRNIDSLFEMARDQFRLLRNCSGEVRVSRREQIADLGNFDNLIEHRMPKLRGDVTQKIWVKL